MTNPDDTKENLDELVKSADFMIANPETIEAMKKKGMPIKSTFETYEQYLDKVFAEKRKNASSVIKQLPHLSDNKIANATVQALYDEIRECFVFGINGAAITLALILLELSLKYRLYLKRREADPNAAWEDIEKLDFTAAINELKRKTVITEPERKILEKFNVEVRNPYIHYNIQKLLRGMIVQELPSINIETGVITVYKNVDASQKSFLWFSGKKVLDRKTVVDKLTFCIGWVNNILG